MQGLREVGPELWVAERPLRVGGVELGSRATIVRLPGGRLLLHSPVSLDAALRRDLEALGEPSIAVAPNRLHHLFLGEYAAAYPGIRLYGAPGLAEKRRDLRFHAVLGDDPPSDWAGLLEQHLFRGLPFANEVVFLHPSSRTLILCDLAFHIGAEAPLLTRLAFRLLGTYGRLGPTRTERMLIRNHARARTSLEHILGWSFERVIVAHGRILERGGREALREGFAWLLH
ncbi:MAG: hypothetical protein ACE5FG_04165 [Myxococcota bacterium]